MPETEALYTITPSVDSTLAIELYKTGWMQKKKKHILYFEEFNGTLRYCPERPEASEISISTDAGSIVCRDAWLNAKKQRRVANFARDELRTATHRQISFRSTRIAAKELRGFVVEGELKIRGISRIVKANVVMNAKQRGTLQVDGEVSICLSDFGISPPSAMLGLIGTKNDGLVRVLLWAHPSGRSLQT